jgi:hypothetical protein
MRCILFPCLVLFLFICTEVVYGQQDRTADARKSRKVSYRNALQQQHNKEQLQTPLYNSKSHCANVTRVKESRGRIAIGIAGVSRGIAHTLPTVEKHVFDHLRNNNFEFDVIWSSVSNPTFFGRPIDEFEVAKARPCIFSIESQQVVREEMFERLCAQRNYILCNNDRIRFNGMTEVEKALFVRKPRNVPQFRNYLCAFNVQSKLASLIRSHAKFNGFTYDAVLLIRPDVAFIRDIDLPQRFDDIVSKNSTIWIPDFQPFDGINDRAAFGNQYSMLKYLERGNAFMTNNSYRLHIAENYLKLYLPDVGIKWEPSTMRFMRVRPMEENGVEVGIIDDFDSNPKYMNIDPDDPDLLRCAGKEFKMHATRHFKYKTINTHDC